MARPEDRCFVRWRTAGDADALARVFDLAAPALLRIAMHQVRHPAAAEDLVQTTFLAAIEHAEGYDPARPLLGWLVGILHNQAKWAARRDGRVVDAARLPERAAGDPLAAAQAAEFTAQVDEGIEQLPEIYRPVLRLHLARELGAAEIAHALGRPSGTVRSQIVRGLELLRAALPAGAALAAFAVLTPARGVAAMREAVLAAGRVRTATVAAAAAGATVLATTMGIKKVLLGAACVLACTAGAWVAGSAVVGADAAAVPAASPRAVTAAVGDTADEAPRDAAPPAAREAIVEAPPSWRLTGTVTGADGAGVAAALVQVTLRCGRQEESSADVNIAVQLPGVVTPAEVAEAQVTRRYERQEQPFAGVHTAADGRYAVDLGELRALPPIDLVRAGIDIDVHANGHAPLHLQLALPHNDPHKELALVRDAQLTLAAVGSGRVLDAAGQPVAGASVTVRDGAGATGKVPPSVQTNADGSFRIASPVGGAMTMLATHATNGAAEHACELAFGRDTAVGDLVLRSLSTLRARATFADGEPAAGILVGIRVPGRESIVTCATTDRDGRIAVHTLAPGRYECRVPARHGPVPTVLAATDGNEVPIVLHGLHLVRFAFADDAGRPLRQLDVGCCVWPSEHGAALAAHAAGGALPRELEAGRGPGASAAPPVLVGSGCWVSGSAVHRDACAEVLVQALPPRNVYDQVLTLRERQRTAGLRVRIAAADRGAVGPVACWLSQVQLGVPGCGELPTERDGGDLIARWYPGRYRFGVRPRWTAGEFGWFAPFETEVVLAADRETLLEHNVVAGGRVRLRVYSADQAYRGDIADLDVDARGVTEGQSRDSTRSFLLADADRRHFCASAPAGVPVLWLPLLPPGRHELVLRSRDHRDATIGVVIEPRAVTDVDVFLQAR